MTTREYFNAVLNANISDEMNEASVEFLSKLDSRNEKRKSVVTKDKAEAASRRDMVLAFLRENEGSFTRDQIAEAIGNKRLSRVVGYACKTLVDGGLVTKTEVKVEKSRKVAYTLA